MWNADYGLDRAVKDVERGGVLAETCRTVVTVRRQNADRQEPALGDDNFTLAAQNHRNVGNLLERSFAGRATVRHTRPRSNSYQLVVGGYTINVYALPSGDPESIAWSTSGLKQELASSNSALAGDRDHQILSFDDVLYEDGDSDVPGIGANRLVLVHWADADASQVRLWVGFPRDNTNGGSPWLQIVEITGLYGDGGRGSGEGTTPAEPVRPFGGGAMPEVPVQWRPSEDDEGTGSGSSAEA